MLDWFRKTAVATPEPIALKRAAGAPHPSAAARSVPEPHAHNIAPYDKDLISGYLADHRNILEVFGKVKQAAQQQQWTEVSAQLAEFRTAFNHHRANESVRLYLHLLSRSGNDLEQMKRFSEEMHNIGKSVALFLRSQADIADVPEKQHSFLANWADIGHVLGKRVSSEEKTLYPMYQDGN